MQQVVLPTTIQTRFVQLYVDGKHYFRCGDVEEHSTILAESLHELGIVPRTRYGIPNADGDRYKLVGDGFCHKIGNQHILTEQSGHYKRGPNQKHLDDLAPAIPEGVTITIDEKVE